MQDTQIDRPDETRAAVEQFFAELIPHMQPDGAVAAAVHSDRKASELFTPAVLTQFFADAGFRLDLATAAQAAIDQKLATQFNVFSLIEPDENRMSDILADLLNPRGNHGQAELFLSILCQKLGLTLPQTGVADVQVQREALTHRIPQFRRRIDILVEAPALLLAIENKINCGEQPRQVADYLEHLARNRPADTTQCVLIYLTPSGKPPESLSPAQAEAFRQSGLLRCWSYTRDLCDWLAACRQAAEAEKIRYFLSDLLSYIRSNIEPAESRDYDD